MPYKLLVLAFIFLSVAANPQGKSTENKIIDTIFKLKEVKERSGYVEKESKMKRHLSVAIYAKPTKNEPYYWVKVWEDNGHSYTTHFNFYVYPKPFTIKFRDDVGGAAISLKDWRRRLRAQHSK
jgi:hypothetical protein